MTLKEAYEVFFGNTNERITGKFIIENVSIAEFKNRHRNLLRKWHPDMNPNNQNIAHEMTIKINEAYKILNNVYKEEEKKQASEKEKDNKTKQKETASKQKNMSPEEREKIIKYYSKMFKKAATIYKYKLFMKYEEDVDKYYELTMFDEKRQQSLVDTYRYIELYKKCVEMFEVQVDMLDKRLSNALKSLGNLELNEEKLHDMYLELIGPYREIMKDSVKYAEIMDWYQNKQELSLTEDRRKDSIILNIDSKIVQRVSQIKNNFKALYNLRKSNMLDETYQKINSKNTLLGREEILKICNKYTKYVAYLDSLSDELHRECMKYIALARNGTTKVDTNFMTKLENDLNSILIGTPEELQILFNDSMQIEKVVQKVVDGSKDRKVKSIYNQTRASYISDINNTIEYLHKLKKMAAREERSLGFAIPDGKVGKNLTDDELVEYYNNLNKLKEQAMYVVIETIYEYLICYYANNTEEKEIPGDILDIIWRIKSSSPEERKFDLSECLYDLDNIYQEKISEYNIRPREKLQDAARMALINKINELKIEMKGYVIPAGIERDFTLIEYFDIISLYEFIERTEDYLYSQMSNKNRK